VANSQVAPAPLVLSIAQRVSHDLIIQASIEYVSSPLVLSCVISYCSSGLDVAVSSTCCFSSHEGNFDTFHPYIGYWRNLWSSPDFTDQIFEDCVDVIHADIVGVWSLRDADEVCLSPHPVVIFCLARPVSFGQKIQD
jgi:hypothetical protein